MYTLETAGQTSPCVVRLGGSVTVRHSARLASEIFSLVAQHHDIELELSGVTDIDAAGVQVLLAGRRLA